MREHLDPPRADGLPQAAASKHPVPLADDARARLRALCRNVLDLGRDAPPGPFRVELRGSEGTRVCDGEGLPIAVVLRGPDGPERREATALLLAKYRNAAPTLAAELLRRLDAEAETSTL